MEKRFEIELPKEIMDAFLQAALGALCFFSSIKIIDFFNMVKKNNNWAVVVYAIVVCLLIGIYFCINAAMKTLKSKSYDELKKEGNLAFGSKALEEVSIVTAYQEKKLKSKKMVKRAKSLVAAAERKQAKENKKESVATDEK